MVAGKRVRGPTRNENAGYPAFLFPIEEECRHKGLRQTDKREQTKGGEQILAALPAATRRLGKMRVRRRHGSRYRTFFEKERRGIRGRDGARVAALKFSGGNGRNGVQGRFFPGDTGRPGRGEELVGRRARRLLRTFKFYFNFCLGSEILQASAQDIINDQAKRLAELFAHKKAPAVVSCRQSAAGGTHQVAHGRVFPPCLFEHEIIIRRERLVRGKGGFKLRRQAEVKGGGTNDEMEQAVNGPDIERTHVAQDGIHPAARLLAGKRHAIVSLAERRFFQAPENTFAHFGGGGIGEGDGNDVSPAVDAGGKRARRRCPAAVTAALGKALKKTPRQFPGFSGPGGRLYPAKPGGVAGLHAGGSMPLSMPWPVDSSTARQRSE